MPPTSQSLPPSPKRTSWPSSTTGCGVVASNARRRDEVEQEVDARRDVDLLERVVRVEVAEQPGGRVEAEDVARRVVRGERREDAERVAAVVVVERQRLGARHRVVAAAAVQEVVAEAAVDDVVAAGVERLLDRGVVQPAGDVDRDDDVVRFASPVLSVSCVVAARPNSGSAMPLRAGLEQAVVAEDAVVAGAAGDPVVAGVAVQLVVLAVAEDRVGAGLAVDDVVAALAVEEVAAADVRRMRGRVDPAVARDRSGRRSCRRSRRTGCSRSASRRAGRCARSRPA